MHENPNPATRAIRILSYNLWHGRAQGELEQLVAGRDPDVLCLQESNAATLPRELHGLSLAVSTELNRLGLALYVKGARFDIEAASSFGLTASRHDRLVGGTDHRLVGARLHDRLADRAVVMGSFHATPFTDSNAARRRQVDEAHHELMQLGPTLPWAMAGDYNHPILLFMLRSHLRRQGIEVGSTPTSTYYKERSLARGKFDLTTVSHLRVTDAVTLPQGASDHKPVLFTVEYAD